MKSRFSLAGRRLVAQLRHQPGAWSYKALAAQLQIDRVTAIRLVGQLESAGLVAVERRPAPRPNIYKLRDGFEPHQAPHFRMP